MTADAPASTGDAVPRTSVTAVLDHCLTLIRRPPLWRRLSALHPPADGDALVYLPDGHASPAAAHGPGLDGHNLKARSCLALPAGASGTWTGRGGTIEIRVARDLTIRDVAGCAGLSPGHFGRALKAQTGHSPHAYVLQMRVERVQDLLLHGARSLAEIALACGVAAKSHMTETLRSTGLPPAQWRCLHGALSRGPRRRASRSRNEIPPRTR